MPMTVLTRFAIGDAATAPASGGRLLGRSRPSGLRAAGHPALRWTRVALLALGVTLIPFAPVPAAAATAPSAKAAATETPEPAEEPAPLPRSEFIDDPTTTKDPFFPNSMRRVPVRATPKARASAVPEPKSLSAGLSLKGITGSRSNPLALINNKTCAVGDVVQVKVPDGEVTLKCVEIRPDSVVITVEGEPGQKVLSLPAR